MAAEPSDGDRRKTRSGWRPRPAPQPGDEQEGVAAQALNSILGANPFVGLDPVRVLADAGAWLRGMGARPDLLVAQGRKVAVELAEIAFGRSEIAPARSDRRFTDPAWTEHPVYRRLMQAYLLLAASMHELVDEARLDWRNGQRAHFAVTLLTDALAPTNTLPGNPAAIKRAFDTAGVSLIRGTRNLIGDVRRNGGMPSMVDTRPFQVGRNIAVTPGAIVHRDEVFELIQYSPTAETVHLRPVVMIPPQINKYYVMDLAPGRSFTGYAVDQGFQYFTISWRNPSAAQRDWDLDTYVRACLDAIDVACEITGSEDANLLGLCAGGVTMSLLLGHLAAKGSPKARSATFAVAVLDTEAPSMMGMFASDATIAAATRRSRRKGVLDGSEMARVFAWLRPNDLVWNYWVNNYLLGNDPPAFDILFWNADNTRLPAALHAGFLDLFVRNPLKRPCEVEVLGTPIDLKQVSLPAYVVSGITDHIAPWAAGYETTKMLGGQVEFVLSSSGHIQSIINPPGNPKASYFIAGPHVDEPQSWLKAATEVRDSWWVHWAGWVGEQAGERVRAPRRLGSRRHPVLEPAPGRYVFER